MKRKPWRSRYFALALICIVIMSSTGLVYAGEADEIGLEPIVEESFGEDSEEGLSELPVVPESAVVTDESEGILTGGEEEILVNEESVTDEQVNSEPVENVIEESEVLNETEEIPTIDETVIEEEKDLIAVEPETDLDMLFESAKMELDPVLTAETEVFGRIQAIYTWVSLAFPEAVITDEEMAVLTQRLLENYGVQSCIISGWDENGEQVFWDLAQIDEVFFNLDVSLDRGVTDKQQWRGFLKGGASPFGYVRDEAFIAEAFTAAYPVSEEDYMETAEEPDDENDVVEANEEELLLSEDGFARFVSGAGEKKGVYINGVRYTNAATGNDGKGGTWKYDGNGNLELNNVHLTQVATQGGCIITIKGNNYLAGGSTHFGLEHHAMNLVDDTIEALTLTGPGTLYAGGGISIHGDQLRIIDTHIESFNGQGSGSLPTYVNGTGMISGGPGNSPSIEGSILIRNSDIHMYNNETIVGISLYTDSSLVIDNSNITIDQCSGEPIHGGTIKLTGCKIVEDYPDVDYSIRSWENTFSDPPYTYYHLQDSGFVGKKLVIKRDGTVTPTPTPTPAPAAVKVPSVSYRTHVQGIGWQGYVKDGAMSGTSGQSKRLEAINIKLTNLPYTGGITYRTHVQKYGWQGWKSNDQMAGTSGEAKRLEAIQIQLTGEIAKYYDVYYQTHIQKFGWSGWASNGEMCGSAGYSYRLEGIKIKLVKKGGAAPGSTANPFYGKAGTASPVSKISGACVGYNTHVQTYGWQNFVYDGAMSGTSGQSKRLEGIQINLVDKPYSGDIVYRTHVQTYGWQTWKKNGQMSGTSGESKRLEGIQIYLTGEMANHYDVYYQVHAQTYGWLDWAKNGTMAGTSGLSKRLEGIKIVLVPKGGKAPGATSKPNVVGGGGKLPDNPVSGSTQASTLSAQTITISGLGAYDSTNGRYNVTYTAQAKNIGAKASGGGALSYAITDKSGKAVSSIIATIDTNGNLKFTGKAAGEFYVTVKAAKKGGYAEATKTIKVNVNKATPVISCGTSVTKYMEDGPINLGASITLGGTMKYESSNTSVLTVDSKGVVTPVKWTGLPKQKEAKVTITSSATPVLNAAKTVTVNVVLKNKQIEKDTEKPVISNITVSNVSSAGYTVTCTVSDNVGIQKVEFPTWTETNGQDDIIWHKGTISGNTASFTIKTSDHKNEVNTNYLTHIYAEDYSGNRAQVDAGTIFVADVQISLDKEYFRGDMYSSYTLKATVSPSDLPNKEVTWKSSNPYVAEVDNNGKVTIKHVGTADITATSVYGNVSASCFVQVIGISMNTPNITINVGDTVTLETTIFPSDITDQEIVWTNLNDDGYSDLTVSLSNAGKVTALKAGQSTIRAEIVARGGETYYTYCNVKVVDP